MIIEIHPDLEAGEALESWHSDVPSMIENMAQMSRIFKKVGRYPPYFFGRTGERPRLDMLKLAESSTEPSAMPIRFRPDVQKKLDRIEIIEDIKRGQADMEAGRLVPHEEAMAEIYAAIAAVGTAKSDKA